MHHRKKAAAASEAPAAGGGAAGETAPAPTAPAAPALDVSDVEAPVAADAGYGRSPFLKSNAMPELIPELGRAVGTLLAAGLDIEPTTRSVSILPGNVCLTGSDGLLIGYKVARQFESHPLRHIWTQPRCKYLSEI
jgi:hypothetical protein